MKDFDKNKELYLMQWDVNNLCGQAVLQKLTVDDFEWVENTCQSNEHFIKSYNVATNIRYCLETDVQYPDELYERYNNLPFSSERMKIGKLGKLVCSLNDNVHIRTSKQVLNHGLVFKGVHRVLPYINRNIDLRKNAENDFQKEFFKLMNYSDTPGIIQEAIEISSL